MLSPLVDPNGRKEALRRFNVAEELEDGLDAPALVARTRYWRAHVLLQHGRPAEARTVLDKAVDEAPGQLVNLRGWMSAMAASRSGR